MDPRRKIENSPLPDNTYTDSTGTYCVDSIVQWVNSNKARWTQIDVKEFLLYLKLDTWGDPSFEPSSNLKLFMEDEERRERVLRANLNYPIIITNDNRIIDGIHRLFKAVYEGHEKIKSIFIDQSTLINFRISNIQPSPRTNLHLPIPDLYLRIPKSRLPSEERERQTILETYFSEHLPSFIEEEKDLLVCLERPQERYGSYIYDNSVQTGLDWWEEGTQVHDIPFQRRISKKGLLAIEDQWMPYSWSFWLQGIDEIPSEIILLHLDDHQDMMSPRIGRRIDGGLYDYITGDSIHLRDPSSVAAAILSGAIGKGSILTPLVWGIEKIHVRHLSFRPQPHSYYRLQKVVRPDGVLSPIDNRISVYLEPSHKENFAFTSNYLVTSNLKEWLKELPEKAPILLHIDMDYFTNRFDGNSSWKGEDTRSHELSLDLQLQHIESIFDSLNVKGLRERIVNTCIGISPGFYPAEFWSQSVTKVIKSCEKVGIL